MPLTSATHGIEIGRRALQAQQTALQVTGHNIANANTPGFARRSVDLENAQSGIASICRTLSPAFRVGWEAGQMRSALPDSTVGFSTLKSASSSRCWGGGRPSRVP